MIALDDVGAALPVALAVVSAGPACGPDDGDPQGQEGATTTSNAQEPSTGLDTATGSGGEATGVDETGSGSADTRGSSGTFEGRPYVLVVPTEYDPEIAAPLVVLLHGYSADAVIQDAYFRFSPDAEEHGYLLALPDGVTDTAGNQFWNATDACCNFGGDPVDDVAYLGALIDDVQAQYNVDAKRVFVVGHSNGGFMAHRLACDIGERIAAIVSLAGATWDDATACPAETPVNILQVHGTDDDTILFDGGDNLGFVYPSANETVAQWAANNGCSGELAQDGTADLEIALAGEETLLNTYAQCPPGGQVALWTIEGGGHIPAFDDGWADAVWAYLDAHPKP